MLITDQAIKIATCERGDSGTCRTRGFLIFSRFARPAVGAIRKTASRPRPLRQSTRRCIPGTTWTRAHTSVGWNVCGSLSGSSGCYGSGSLGPFVQVGALMEGEPKTDLIANTVTRAIYVLDIASGPNQDEVVLYVYTKVDTITTDSDTVTVTLSQTISLPLVGGISRQPSMAANKQFLFIGTDRSPYAVEIDKRTFSVTQVGGGFSPPINVYGILTDQYGYAAISFGSFRSAHTGFNVVGPDGSAVEDGDDSQVMLNIVDGLGLRP